MCDITGTQPGPVLGLCAAIHGDEVNGRSSYTRVHFMHRDMIDTNIIDKCMDT